MVTSDILPAWGLILRGYRPLLSIEITRECPLRCPGCYAYEPEHLGGLVTLRQLAAPVCSECGCLASAGLASIGRHRLAGLVPLSGLFTASRRIGEEVSRHNAAEI